MFNGGVDEIFSKIFPSFVIWIITYAHSNAVIVSVPENFDIPIRKQVVPAKNDPLNSDRKATLTCSRYRGFVVKETDLGQKGASRLAIVPVYPGSKPVICREENLSGEFVLEGDQGWSGYFRGARGGYVFFEGDDGQEGGMPIAIFDASTGKRLFVDTIGDRFSHISLNGSSLILDYRRIYRTGCSLYPTEATCWAAVKKDTGLSDQAKDGCRTGYQQILSAEIARRSGAVARDQIVKETLESPSVIEYNVHAILNKNKEAKKVASGKVDCRPAE